MMGDVADREKHIVKAGCCRYYAYCKMIVVKVVLVRFLGGK